MITRNIRTSHIDEYYEEHEDELCDNPVIVAHSDSSEWDMCLGKFHNQPLAFMLREDGYIVGRFVFDEESIADVCVAFMDIYYNNNN